MLSKLKNHSLPSNHSQELKLEKNRLLTDAAYISAKISVSFHIISIM
jgi:hypothetical protein